MKEELHVILGKVHALFMRCGIKSLTMDDIARELKISKKTLYEYVEDKQDLVLKVVEYHIQHEKVCTCQIVDTNSNAIDELMAISEHVSQNIQQIHPSIYFDLEKYYSQAWDEFKKYKSEHIYQCICTNLTKGIQQGFYRHEINIPIIAKLYIHRIDVVFNDEIFPRDAFSVDKVYLEMVKYHLYGILNKKGIDYLLNKLKKA